MPAWSVDGITFSFPSAYYAAFMSFLTQLYITYRACEEHNFLPSVTYGVSANRSPSKQPLAPKQSEVAGSEEAV